VTALIGQGGLGKLVLDGFQRDFHTTLIVGAGLCVVLAVIADLLLLGLGRMLTPWSRRRRP
jgi:osmoprotectant transport system permease protein